jgi:hypothetical protein
MIMQLKRAMAVSSLVLGLAGAALAADAASPFNGKDLSGWKAKSDDGKSGEWTVGTASLDPKDPRELAVDPKGTELVNRKGHSVDLYTEAKFGDVTVDLEVMVPQGSNSGVYLMGKYEVQVLDSYGKDKTAGTGDMAAIYSTKAPTNPHYKKPGEWQSLHIEFVAPKFGADGKKTANAKFVKVVLNGDIVHENVEVEHGTGGELKHEEEPMGPLMFQGNHGAVAVRNIKITAAK